MLVVLLKLTKAHLLEQGMVDLPDDVAFIASQLVDLGGTVSTHQTADNSQSRDHPYSDRQESLKAVSCRPTEDVILLSTA